MTNQTNDVIDVTSTGGVATVDGGDGNDVIRVNYDEHDNQTFANGLAGTLTLHGGNGSDEYDIGLSGLPERERPAIRRSSTSRTTRPTRSTSASTSS